MRFEAQAAPLELQAEMLRLRMNRAARDLEAEIAKPQAQQRRVVESCPAGGGAHRKPVSGVRAEQLAGREFEVSHESQLSSTPRR